MESEAKNEGLDWECDEYNIIKIVKQVYRTPYLNRLRQFFLRLLRNNLYIGKTNYGFSPTCVICGKHPEKCIPILLTCEVTVSLVRQLIHSLKEADLLNDGSNIECFLFKGYCFNTIENLSLVTLWDFIYKARFTPEKHSVSMFFRYLHYKLSQVQLLAPNLKLGLVSLLNAIKRNHNIRYNDPDF